MLVIGGEGKNGKTLRTAGQKKKIDQRVGIEKRKILDP